MTRELLDMLLPESVEGVVRRGSSLGSSPQLLDRVQHARALAEDLYPAVFLFRQGRELHMHLHEIANVVALGLRQVLVGPLHENLRERVVADAQQRRRQHLVQQLRRQRVRAPQRLLRVLVDDLKGSAFRSRCSYPRGRLQNLAGVLCAERFLRLYGAEVLKWSDAILVRERGHLDDDAGARGKLPGMQKAQEGAHGLDGEAPDLQLARGLLRHLVRQHCAEDLRPFGHQRGHYGELLHLLNLTGIRRIRQANNPEVALALLEGPQNCRGQRRVVRARRCACHRGQLCG
mmetsp:Transcript_58015/g.188813  ORF Transcript_58015/g.188813 Transcript_58015/m.188813 type:complete len:289 (+) Transcript_58015:454-1320(+)